MVVYEERNPVPCYGPEASTAAFYPLGMEGGAATGVRLQENGSILFRILAPEAQKVSVSLDSLSVHRGGMVDILELERTGGTFPPVEISLNPGDGGFFEYVLSPEELEGFYGPLRYTFIVDGARIVHPYGRTVWQSGRMANVVEIPDPELGEMLWVQRVPHGTVSYELFWSEVRRDDSPCLVYKPAGYDEGQQFYPTVYLQHGGGENETGWFSLGSIAPLMDNLIAAGKVEPALVVMNNTHVKYDDDTAARLGLDARHRVFGAVERLLVSESIPYIERKYRVKRDKWSRAIAGLSQGSMQASFVGFSHPELFGYLGLFSSSIRCRHYWEKYEDNPQLQILRENPQRLAEDYRIIYRGVGSQERESRPWHKEDDAYLALLGVDRLSCYHHAIHPAMCHEWGCFRRSLYDFMQLIFR